ncbi:DUF883 domain-containing protein [Alteromonas oceanisediminis]|uniref:DUF883 domain-containing protein n=1 Tax=Alteromonas oceanisediminis TaxID=2836180 RepID=UPI001BD9BC7F|nr:DUF883 domain-containing protein [Alteromonas oceanisediminis]MBT0586696.1 DUF883 domain-containing protein [Alteromonas oceanisediminis]
MNQSTTKETFAAKDTTNSSAGSTHPVADRVKDTLHSSVDALSERVGKTEETLRNSATHSSEAVAQKRKEMEAKWEQSSIKRYAVENPVATAGIAFAAGALLASFMRKK